MKIPASSERSAVIDCQALAENIAALRGRIGPAALMAVVKADAYGHGVEEIAAAARAAGVTRFGVAHVSEALVLRRHLGPGPMVLAWLHTAETDLEAALAEGIDLGINGTELPVLLAAAESLGMPARVHVKVDTGLGRNGAMESQWAELFARLAGHQQEGLITVCGIMSHLAVADEPERPETDDQKAAFERACELAAAAGLTGLTRHLANTPATLTREDLHYDMCRVGLGLYGLSPFPERPAEEFGLRPVMTLRTLVALVKPVPAGQGVSYGLNYRTEGPSHLGLIPLGYADGIPRIAVGAHVSIAGQHRPVVGRVAMDQMVVDLGEDPQAMDLQGAEATVFGGGDGPRVEEWAAAAQTINYEIVTRISPRVPREYRGTDRSALSVLLASHEAETAEDMRDLGESFAAHLRAGDVVVLSGPLGAGKTTLTQGIATGLGVGGQVISPTFVLSRIHRNDAAGPRPGGPDLVHVDAYRLGPDGDLDSLGLDDTLGRSVTVVEWGESLDRRLGERTFLVRIERAAVLGGGIDEDGALSFDDEGAVDPRTVTIELVFDADADSAQSAEGQAQA